MPRRRKYESRKGFTLVEMIVVLLILAVVTSMAVPAFSRQIDDAKEKKAVTEAQACVTAGAGLGAQLYSKTRAAALQSVSTDANASTTVTAALTGWASSVTDKGPTLTGDLALTEGQGQYYLKPGNLQSGTAAGADKLKAAAGVDGTVEDFWCSGTGQIVYLRYLSADGILVAYTNNVTSGSNITIPTPDVPEPDPNPPTVDPDPKPEPVPTSAEFYVKKVDADDTTTQLAAKFEILKDGKHFTYFDTFATGPVLVKIGQAGTYTLREITPPSGYSAAADATFVVKASDADANVLELVTVESDTRFAGTYSGKPLAVITDKKLSQGDSSGDLIFYIKDADDEDIPDGEMSFYLTDTSGNILTTAVSIKDGKVCFPVSLDENATTHPHVKKEYHLVPVGTPSGRQEVFQVGFSLYPDWEQDADNQWHLTGFHIMDNGASNVWNDANNEYGTSSIGDDKTSYTFYSKKLAKATIVNVDDSGEYVKGSSFLFTQDGRKFKLEFKDGKQEVYVKRHDGDNIPLNTPYLKEKSNFTIAQTVCPSGYAKFPAQIFVTFPDDNFAVYTYADYAQGDGTLRLKLINPVTPTVCQLTIDVVDDAGNTVSNGCIKLSTTDGSIYDSPNNLSYSSKSKDCNGFPASATVFPGKSYTLSDHNPYYGYTKAEATTFTIPAGSTAFTITLRIHSIKNSNSEKVPFTIDNVKFTAKNWSEKLTHDNDISFSKELLCWKGKLYYNIKSIDHCSNSEYTSYWVNGQVNGTIDSAKLDAADDPITKLNKYLKANPDKYSKYTVDDYLVEIGQLRNVKDAANTFNRGDMLLFPSSNASIGYKLYVYTGKSGELKSVPPDGNAASNSNFFVEMGNSGNKNYTIIP